MNSTQSDALVCPDCGTEIQGVESATCSMGHKPVKLDWWDVCACGHDTHYDMTTFCLEKGCTCEAWEPDGRRRRQITRRTI